MSEYMRLTEDIRNAYADMHCPDPLEDHSEGCKADDTFDYWLAEAERAAAARALEEAADQLDLFGVIDLPVDHGRYAERGYNDHFNDGTSASADWLRAAEIREGKLS